MTWVLDQAPVTDSTQAFVLCVLADWADDNGYCWPSVDRVASRARCSESTARRHIRALENAGLVVRTSASHGRATNTYRIIVTNQPSQNDTPVNMTGFATSSPAQTGVINRVNLTPRQNDRVGNSTLAPMTANPGTHDTSTLAPMTPEPSLNRHEPPAAPREPQPPQPIHELETAIRTAGLGARFDRLSPAEIATIETLILAHSIPALVASARSQHRRDNPALFAKAWIQTWLALPVRQTAAPAAKPECGACDHGWLPENSEGQAVACPTCRPAAAARAVYVTPNC